MVIRIRLRTRTSPDSLRSQIALASAAFLTPLALIAFTICFWSFAAEVGLTGEFYLTAGLFSHWQVWLAAAVLLAVGARLLGSYGAAKVELAAEQNSNIHSY